MRVVFAGTPAFALPSLEALIAAGHSVLAVYTQPDRPAGRGRRISQSAIKESALAHGLPVRQPTSLKDGAVELASLAPDVVVVVAYGLLLPPDFLAVPVLGCINVHASLLPRWRGAAPIARAIEAGDHETGVSIMRMEAGLDTGPVYAESRVPIDGLDTTARLEPRLARLGATLLIETLPRILRGETVPKTQYEASACYAPKLRKEEATIDWHQPAKQLHRKIRALNPWPVASTWLRGQPLRVWEVGPLEASNASAPPGTVIDAQPAGIRVQTGSGRLTLTRLQAPGGKALTAREFLNGTRLVPGERLGDRP